MTETQSRWRKIEEMKTIKDVMPLLTLYSVLNSALAPDLEFRSCYAQDCSIFVSHVYEYGIRIF